MIDLYKEIKRKQTEKTWKQKLKRQNKRAKKKPQRRV